jgi:protein TonB
VRAAVACGGPQRRRLEVAALAASTLLHGAAFAAAARLPHASEAHARPELVEIEEVTSEPPVPAPPAPAPAPRLAITPPAHAPEPAPPADAPPPPAEEPSPPEAPTARAPPRVGVSLSSTAAGGTFAAGAGNTLYGKSGGRASDPAEVAPYTAERYAPPARLSVPPRLLEAPEVPYPPAARKAGVEGRVTLVLGIGPDGRVVEARVVEDPGAGLGEAARAGALRFRFSPALLAGDAVGTEIRFTYTFVLE